MLLLQQATHWFQLLSLDGSTEQQAGVDGHGGSCGLDLGGVDQDGVNTVEVGVYHEWGATSQVDVLFPPIRHVVGGPPEQGNRLENLEQCTVQYICIVCKARL